MPKLIASPLRVAAAGEPPKFIDEYVGSASDGTSEVSIARMQSPGGWAEPGQRPTFDEWTIVVEGTVVIEHEGGRLEVGAGQAAFTAAGEWVRYSTPGPEGARYFSVCVPAFTFAAANRDPDG